MAAWSSPPVVKRTRADCRDRARKVTVCRRSPKPHRVTSNVTVLRRRDFGGSDRAVESAFSRLALVGELRSAYGSSAWGLVFAMQYDRIFVDHRIMGGVPCIAAEALRERELPLRASA